MAALRIISVFVLLVTTHATKFQNCNDGVPPKSVDITDCVGAFPSCSMFVGKSYDINVTIVTDRVVNILKPTATLTPLGGDPINLPLGDDVCSLVVTGCPIQPATDAVLSWPVLVSGNNLGGFSGQLRLDDENGQNVACAVVEVIIL